MLSSVKFLRAQTVNCAPDPEGFLAYHGTDLLDSIIEVERRQDRYDRTLRGYRIQIAALSSRRDAEERQEELEEEFSELPYFISYETPYYKLRLGNFRSRLDAFETLLELKEAGFDGFIVPDEIEFPALPYKSKQ